MRAQGDDQADVVAEAPVQNHRDGPTVGGLPGPGRINFVGAMSPPAGSLTPWPGLSGELARNAPNLMSRIHGRAAPDHAIVNEKAARSAITETATE